MINPELIAGMLFLPAMEVSEAIEVVGAERFSHYTGWHTFPKILLVIYKMFYFLIMKENSLFSILQIFIFI